MEIQDNDRTQTSTPSNDDSVYLGLIIFGSVVFALGLLFIATRICCSSFLSICLNDPTLSANTIIVRVSSWTSEKMGMKKESQKTEINGLGQYRHDDHPTINNDKDKRYVKKMFEANNHLQTDGSKVNWFEKINGTTPVITVRDYEHYYSRKYHQFDTRKVSQDTLFSTGSEDSNVSYVRLTPYGELDEDRMDNKDVPSKKFQRPSIDSLSVPNLVDQYQERITYSTNKPSDYQKNDNPRFHHTNSQKVANINDKSFATYRNEDALNTLNVPDETEGHEEDEELHPEHLEVKQNRSSFLRMKRRSLVSPTTYDKLHTVNNIINGNVPNQSTSNTMRARKSPTGFKRRKTLH